MAHSVKHLTLAQVMIWWFMSSSPASGPVLTAQSLEPALDSVSPSLSLPLLCSHCLSLSLSLSLSKVNIKKERKKERKKESQIFPAFPNSQVHTDEANLSSDL